MKKIKTKNFAFLILSFLIFSQSKSQDHFFTYSIKQNTRINNGQGHLEPDSSLEFDFENGAFEEVNFYKNRYDTKKNKIASDVKFYGEDVYDSFTYNNVNQLTCQYTYDQFGLIQSIENIYNDDGLLTNSIGFIRENDEMIKSFQDSFTYYKQGNKLDGVLVYYYINMQGSEWEQTAYYGFNYNGQEYPAIIVY